MDDNTDTLKGYYKVSSTDEFDAIRWRFYGASGCTGIFELADFLGTTAAHISDARRRLCIPAEWFQLMLSKTSADRAWLTDGLGEREL